MLNTKEEVENWLINYNIKNYIINEDLTVDVNGNVNLSKQKIKKFPFKFRFIKGDFFCSYNELISLKNAPERVEGSFDCARNKLTSLEYSPISVGGFFECSYNDLLSLEFCTKEVKKDFYCRGNLLTSLEHIPEVIEGTFDCSSNKIKSIQFSPKRIKGDFILDYNNIDIKTLYLFNSCVETGMKTDFGYKEDFLNKVIKQKLLKEKEDLTKIINSTENGILTKKRL